MLNLLATARFCQVHFPSFPITSANNCNRNASGTPNPFNPPSPLTRRVTRCSPVFFPSVFHFHFFSCVPTPVALQTNTDASRVANEHRCQHQHTPLLLLTIRSDQAWLAAHARAGKLGPQHAAPGSLDNNNNQVHLSPSFKKNLLSTGTNSTANTAATLGQFSGEVSFRPSQPRGGDGVSHGKEIAKYAPHLLCFSFAFSTPRIVHKQYGQGTNAHHRVLMTHARHQPSASL
jgi:hypothetical protein